LSIISSHFPPLISRLLVVRLLNDTSKLPLSNYDELKNHLSTNAAGSQDLLFRSKNPDGVLQEAYALVAMYNIIRGLMSRAGQLYDVNPLDISFVETVEVMKDTTPRFQSATTDELRVKILCRILRDIAECVNKRPLRNR